MISFKDAHTKFFQRTIPSPSVTVTSELGQKFTLKFDSQDTVMDASYEGKTDLWMASLCQLVIGKKLQQLLKLTLSDWETTFKDDLFFWDMKNEMADSCFFYPLEILYFSLNTFRGNEYLYQPTDPLVCRCFGVREKDIVQYLQTAEQPGLEDLGIKTKATMGCRSCLPQIKKWLSPNIVIKKHFYKDRPIAEWLLEIDHALKDFPISKEWKMEVESFKGNQVIITYDFSVSQLEEEKTSSKLQGFLASVLDSDLAFFLRRSRQR